MKMKTLQRSHNTSLSWQNGKWVSRISMSAHIHPILAVP